jgi:hypothetical protein
MMNLQPNFISVCKNQCKKNERKLLMNRPTDSSKAICPPLFKGGHKNTAYIQIPKSWSNVTVTSSKILVSQEIHILNLNITTSSVSK